MERPRPQSRARPAKGTAERSPPGRSAIDERTRTAFHEAGHAVLAAALDSMPSLVSIRPRDGELGFTRYWMVARTTALAQISLAGFAAEHLRTGRRPRQLHAEVGLAILSHFDADLVAAFHGERNDGHGAVRAILRTFSRRTTRSDVEREVERLYDAARESLVAVWKAVDVVARALLRVGELDGARLERLLRRFALYDSVLPVQHRHGLRALPPQIPSDW